MMEEPINPQSRKHAIRGARMSQSGACARTKIHSGTCIGPQLCMLLDEEGCEDPWLKNVGRFPSACLVSDRSIGSRPV
eukprot:1990481-Pleurochrysis_carterae.AAC.1